MYHVYLPSLLTYTFSIAIKFRLQIPVTFYILELSRKLLTAL